jgi:hypothetical protein
LLTRGQHSAFNMKILRAASCELRTANWYPYLCTEYCKRAAIGIPIIVRAEECTVREIATRPARFSRGGGRESWSWGRPMAAAPSIGLTGGGGRGRNGQKLHRPPSGSQGQMNANPANLPCQFSVRQDKQGAIFGRTGRTREDEGAGGRATAGERACGNLEDYSSIRRALVDHLDHLPSSLPPSLPSVLLLLHSQPCLLFACILLLAACLCIRLYSRVTNPVCPPAALPRR